jgi:hypothetical protein
VSVRTKTPDERVRVKHRGAMHEGSGGRPDDEFRFEHDVAPRQWFAMPIPGCFHSCGQWFE